MVVDPDLPKGHWKIVHSASAGRHLVVREPLTKVDVDNMPGVLLDFLKQEVEAASKSSLSYFDKTITAHATVAPDTSLMAYVMGLASPEQKKAGLADYMATLPPGKQLQFVQEMEMQQSILGPGKDPMERIVRLVPGLGKSVTVPGDQEVSDWLEGPCCSQYIGKRWASLVVHLNDTHGWSREKILGFLEHNGCDLTVREEVREHADGDRGADGAPECHPDCCPGPGSA